MLVGTYPDEVVETLERAPRRLYASHGSNSVGGKLARLPAWRRPSGFDSLLASFRVNLVQLVTAVAGKSSFFLSAGRRGRPCDPQAFGPPSPHVVFRKRLALGPPLTEVLYYWVGSRFSCSKPQPLTL